MEVSTSKALIKCQIIYIIDYQVVINKIGN